MWTVSKEFRFEAAHALPHLPESHKCHHLHGHSYKVVVVCSGDLIPDKSWVIDFADISAAVQPLINKLDHQNLNDIICENTTAENIAFWFYWKLRDKLPLNRIDVFETPTTIASYSWP